MSAFHPGSLEAIANPNPDEAQAVATAVANNGWVDIHANEEDTTTIGRARWLAPTAEWEVVSFAWSFIRKTRATYKQAEALVRRLEDAPDVEAARRCR